MFIDNMEYNLLGYFAKFTVPVWQVHFAKSRTQIDLIFCRIASPHFSNSKVDVAKSPGGDGSFRMILWYHRVTGYLLGFWDN
jgi:hypothetical protein